MKPTRLRSAIATVMAVIVWVSFFPAPSSADIAIEFDDLVFGPEGSLLRVAEFPVSPELVGQNCQLAVIAENQASVHPGNELIVTTGETVTVIPNIEDEVNGGVTETYQLVIGPTIDVDLRFGPDGISSLGFALSFDCTETGQPSIDQQSTSSTMVPGPSGPTVEQSTTTTGPQVVPPGTDPTTTTVPGDPTTSSVSTTAPVDPTVSVATTAAPGDIVEVPPGSSCTPNDLAIDTATASPDPAPAGATTDGCCSPSSPTDPADPGTVSPDPASSGTASYDCCVPAGPADPGAADPGAAETDRGAASPDSCCAAVSEPTTDAAGDPAGDPPGANTGPSQCCVPTAGLTTLAEATTATESTDGPEVTATAGATNTCPGQADAGGDLPETPAAAPVVGAPSYAG